MSTLLEKMKKYLAETPQEIIDKDWADTAIHDEVGPSIDDFLEYSIEKYFPVNNTSSHSSDDFLNDNPKYKSSDFFLIQNC